MAALRGASRTTVPSRWALTSFMKEGSFPPWAWAAVPILLLIVDSALSVLIVRKVPYTEIDWVAYMQEVSGWLVDGETDYTKLKGDTGPLVYPGGFMWIFSGLYFVTEKGKNISMAQCLFACLYIMTLALVFRIYVRCRVTPLWALPLLIISKRVHSIFMLRMFNDCVAMALLYAAILLFTGRKWAGGCVLFSLAVSVKMNILLFAPGLFLLLLQSLGLRGAIVHIAICSVVQLLAGYPFLYHHPVSYLTKAFELGRVFLYKWTVNFRFLPEEVFVSKPLSVLLLALTALALVAFASKYARAQGPAFLQVSNDLTPRYIATTLMLSNFIGIVFARSLHYQFYSWYFHSLPYLAWEAGVLPWPVKVAVLLAIEVAFNVYPATPQSSLLLQGAHLILLLGLWFSEPPLPRPARTARAGSTESDVERETNRLRRKPQKAE